MFGKSTPKQQLQRKVARNVMERKVGNSVGAAFGSKPSKVKRGSKKK